jgi:hypothetical protein
MRIKEEKIAYWAKIIAQKIEKSENVVVKDEENLEGKIKDTITRNFQLEDEIEEEARRIMQEHAKEIAREGVDYSTFFNRVKRQLMKEKGVVM